MRAFAQKPKAEGRAADAGRSRSHRAFWGQSREVRNALHLQRVTGNRDVPGWPKAHMKSVNKSSQVHEQDGLSRLFTETRWDASEQESMQTKLKMGSPGDQHEQEADLIAERILQRPEEPFQGACENEGAFALRRKEAGGRPRCSAPQVAAQSQRTGLSGRPLGSSDRAFFEPRLGADLSTVRLHDDAASAEVAEALDARAFTVGRHIFFGCGNAPHSSLSARHLLAHELVHTLQQGASGRIARQCQGRWSAMEIPPDASSLTARVAVDMGELRISDTVSVSPVVGRAYIKFILPPALQERIAPDLLGGFLQRSRITMDISGNLSSTEGASAAARFPDNELCLSVGFSQSEDAWQADVRILEGTRLEIPLQVGMGTPLHVPPASSLGRGAANLYLHLENDLTVAVGALRITELGDFRDVWREIMDHVKDALQIPLSNIRIPLDARLRAALGVPLPIPGGAPGATGLTVDTLGDLRLRADFSSETEGYQLRLSGQTSGSVLGGLVSLELWGGGRLFGPIPSTVRLGDLSSEYISQLLAESSGGGQVTGRLRAFGVPGQLQSDFRIVNGRLVGNASLLTPLGVGGGRYQYTLDEGLSAQMGMAGLVNLTIAPAQNWLESEGYRSTGPQPLDLGTSVTGVGLTGLLLGPRTTSILSLGVGPHFITLPSRELRVGVYGGVDFQLRFR